MLIRNVPAETVNRLKKQAKQNGRSLQAEALAALEARAARALRRGDAAAPDLLLAETLNAFWKAMRSGYTVPARPDILDVLDRIRIVPSRPLAARAAEMAERFDHSVMAAFIWR